MLRVLLSLLFFATTSPALAFKLPSSVSVFQSFDNDKNRNTALDFNLGTPIMAMLHGGISTSKLQYDDENSGRNTSFYLGVESNPLRDWVFGFNYTQTRVSDQMTIFDPSVNIKTYFKHFDLGLDVGHRTIQTTVTEALEAIVNFGESQVEDENFWWALGAHVYISPKFSVGASYRQYQYSTNFGFFNRTLAQLLGYSLDTINYGASFPNFILSFNGNVILKRWDLSLEYQFIENEFDDTNTTTWIPSVGFHFSKRWFFNMSIGLSRGVTEDEDDTSGGFLGLGTTYSF